MGTIYFEPKGNKGKGWWKVQFRQAGYPYVYNRYGDEEEAREFFDTTNSLIAQQSVLDLNTVPENFCLDDERLLTTLSEYARSGRCTDQHRKQLPTIVRHIGEVQVKKVKIGELTEEWIRAYIKHMRAQLTRRKTFFAYATIGKQLGLLKLIIKWRSKSLKQPMPTFEFSSKMFPRGWEIERERRLELDEEQALLNRFSEMKQPAGKHWELLLGLAVETFARQNELISATWSEIKFTRGHYFWRIPRNHTKSYRTRVVPLTATAVRILKRLNGMRHPTDPRIFHHFSSAAVASAMFHRHVKALGIVDLRFHDLRHEGISRFVLHQRQFSITQIMRMAGHATIEMTERYTNLRGDELAALLI